MIDQTAATMGLGEPISDRPRPTIIARAKTWLADKRRGTVEALRTRRWLRWGLALIVLGGVAASAVVTSRAITAPAAEIVCPATPKAPEQGKKQTREVKPKRDK